MTEFHTSLSLAALKEIFASVDRSITVFDRAGTKLTYAEQNVRDLLVKLRRQILEQIERHPDNAR